MSVLKIFILSFFLFVSGAWSGENPYVLFRDIEQGMVELDMNVGDNLVKIERTRADIKLLFDRFNKFNDEFSLDLMEQVDRDEVLRGLQLTIMHRSVKT
ncbi:MAG: hypothetical protein EP326_08110, partial [Deltaproteobacteria bacterium]